MRMRHFLSRIIVPLVLALALTVGGGGSSPVEASGEKSVSEVKNLIRVPMARQDTDYTCGVTALQSILGYYGLDTRLDVLAAAVKPDPENGTSYLNIANYAKSQGFEVTIRTNMTLDELKGYIDKRLPVLLVIQAWTDSSAGYAANEDEDGHYVVAIGYDDKNFYFMDPSTLGHYTYIPTAEFVSRWHDYDSHENRYLNQFGMIMTKPISSPYNPEDITRLD